MSEITFYAVIIETSYKLSYLKFNVSKKFFYVEVITLFTKHKPTVQSVSTSVFFLVKHGVRLHCNSFLIDMYCHPLMQFKLSFLFYDTQSMVCSWL